jgi:hypothetical protein
VIETFLDRKASFPPEMMKEESNPFLKGFVAMYKAFIESLRSYGDCDKYADKLEMWDRDKLVGSWVLVAEPMRSGFTVLNHGDFWLNNMLFKNEDDNSPSDVSLIDFQGNAWAGPAVDLHYFFVSSISDDVKVDKFDEFVKFYHQELSESLEKLHFDQHIPTLDEVYTDLLDKAHVGKKIISNRDANCRLIDDLLLLAATSILFIMFVTKYESSEEMNLETMMSTESPPEFYHRIYRNETFKKAVKMWLPFLDERGYLDVMLPTKKEEVNGN